MSNRLHSETGGARIEALSTKVMSDGVQRKGLGGQLHYRTDKDFRTEI